MANKYLAIAANGVAYQEIEFTQTSTGVGDAGEGVALNSQGVLDDTLFPPGIGADIISLIASEALSAGDLINIWLNSSTPSVRKADASAANAGKTVDGFVKSSVASGATAQVYVSRGILVTGLTGLTAGSTYFLSGSTPGGVTATRPTTSGHTVQIVGKAYSSSALYLDPQPPVILA